MNKDSGSPPSFKDRQWNFPIPDEKLRCWIMIRGDSKNPYPQFCFYTSSRDWRGKIQREPYSPEKLFEHDSWWREKYRTSLATMTALDDLFREIFRLFPDEGLAIPETIEYQFFRDFDGEKFASETTSPIEGIQFHPAGITFRDELSQKNPGIKCARYEEFWMAGPPLPISDVGLKRELKRLIRIAMPDDLQERVGDGFPLLDYDSIPLISIKGPKDPISGKTEKYLLEDDFYFRVRSWKHPDEFLNYEIPPEHFLTCKLAKGVVPEEFYREIREKLVLAQIGE